MTRCLLLASLIVALLLPGTASAVIPNPLFGPYVFLGGGAGLRLADPTNAAAAKEFRWGPSVELGGDLAFVTIAAGSDLRISTRTMAGQPTPLDIDLLAAVGLITPTPLVRFFVRLRGGLAWGAVPGVKAAADPRAAVFAPDLGFRFRFPNAPASFQISFATGARVPFETPESPSLEAELRLGVKFP
mgnify:CR=1 FL=1